MIKITKFGAVIVECHECGRRNSIVSDEPKDKVFSVKIGNKVNFLCGKCLFRLVNESWRHLFKPEYFDYAVM